jgi:hypothetical protein
MSPVSSHVSNSLLWNYSGIYTPILYLQGRNYISSSPLRDTLSEIKVNKTPLMSKVLTGQTIRESLVNELEVLKDRIAESHNLPNDILSVKKHIPVCATFTVFVYF